MRRARFPIVPPPLPEEAFSSWLGRLAARYNLTPTILVETLLREKLLSQQMAAWGDWLHWPILDNRLLEVSGLADQHLHALRAPGARKRSPAGWAREHPIWCGFCLAEDLKTYGEVYIRKTWRHGGTVICPQHRCLLTSTCPRCHEPTRLVGWMGHQRLWCAACGALADQRIRPHAIPIWPFNTPEQIGRCRSVSYRPDAIPALLEIQAALMATYCADRSSMPWDSDISADASLERLLALAPWMLRPLRERSIGRARQGRFHGRLNPWRSQWGPADLRPPVMAAVLLLLLALLAPDHPRAGAIQWTPDLRTRTRNSLKVTEDSFLVRLGMVPGSRLAESPDPARRQLAILLTNSRRQAGPPV